MELQIRNVSKTCPNGVQALEDVTLTVPRKPALAGIDPHHLLDWEERSDDDNIDAVEAGQ